MNDLNEEDSTELLGEGEGHSPVERAQPFTWGKPLLITIGVILSLAIVIFIITVALYSPPKRQHDTISPNSTTDIRLDANIRPYSYQLKIRPEILGQTFTVREDIQFTYFSGFHAAQYLRLHDRGLNVTSAWLSFHAASGQPEQTLVFQKASYLAEFDFVDLFFVGFEDALSSLTAPFNATVHIEADGQLIDNLNGFYRSSYTENGTTHFLGVTDFEPTSARAAFIGFDEPAMKATFAVTLEIDPTLTAASNMPVESTVIDPESKLKVVKFQTSPLLPTYLVSWLVSPLAYTSGEVSDRLPTGIFSTPEAISQTGLTLRTAAGALRAFESLFQVSYPFPKLDLVALPDYSAGAMENAGLITGRTVSFLADEKESDAKNFRRVAVVVCHEIAHQWFGDLVTMKWWDDLWLNEGFATFMEHECVNQVFPSWQIWSDMITDARERALRLDALQNTHAVRPVGLTLAEISQQFDAISYEKGGNIIRMAAHTLGPEQNFYDGLHQYFFLHAWGNAESTDLWDALGGFATHQEKQAFVKMMENWTLLPGFPLLNVSRVNDQTVSISQSRYRHVSNMSSTGEEDPLWTVPIEIGETDPLAPPAMQFLTQRTATFSWNSARPVTVNPFGVGFYRVLYHGELWDQIVTRLQTDVQGSYGNLQRALLLSDATAFALSDKLDPVDFLNFEKFLKFERHFAVWQIALKSFYDWDLLLREEIFYSDFQNFWRYLVEDEINRLGFQKQSPENMTTTILRNDMLQLGGYLEIPTVVSFTTTLFRNSMTSPTSFKIPIEIRDAVYFNAVAAGGDEEWNFILQKYQETNVDTEKIRCLYALTKTRRHDLLKKTLELAMDSTVVRSQDAFRLIVGVARNLHGRDLVYTWVKSHISELSSVYGQLGSNLLPRSLGSVIDGFTLQEQKDDVEEFLASHVKETETASRQIEQSLEALQARINWLTQHLPAIKTFLADFVAYSP